VLEPQGSPGPNTRHRANVAQRPLRAAGKGATLAAPTPMWGRVASRGAEALGPISPQRPGTPERRNGVCAASSGQLPPEVIRQHASGSGNAQAKRVVALIRSASARNSASLEIASCTPDLTTVKTRLRS
jgi:hypothetical protein